MSKNLQGKIRRVSRKKTIKDFVTDELKIMIWTKYDLTI